MRIISHRLLPEIPDPQEFRDCLQMVLHRDDDWVWLAEIPDENSRRYWALLAPDDEIGRVQKRQLLLDTLPGCDAAKGVTAIAAKLATS